MFQKLLVLAVLYFLSKHGSDATDTSYRLNTPIVPSAYQILITPRFNTNDGRDFTFDGEVTIKFTTTANTNQIKFHSEDLNFTDANIVVTNLNTNTIVALNTTNPLEFQTIYTFAYINLLTDLVPNVEYTVKITYVGPIREDLNGFYSNYYYENGVKKWLSATQMEPTHARKAFPCFDEPGLKATFTMVIDRPSNYQISLSNTKMQSSIDLGNGYVRETFNPTPIMPTYLVAFLVSELEAANYSIDGSKEFGIFTRPEAKSQASYAFDFGKKVVDALGTYYDIDYYSTNQNLKLDHVALPDFRAGAMENWGLVKYREALLLYDPQMSGPYFKYRIAQILAHETTHMWFGNLVTCHWWSNIWLNEGFANYFQDYITAFVEPELGSANLLVTGSVYTAYSADQSINAPPINNNNVNSPAEISGHFGSITYQKGGSVIRMIHHLIGDEAFKLGLHNYLTTNSFSSGYPELLYAGLQQGAITQNSLTSYSNASVSDIMSSWITQAGHPILQVNIDYATDVITMSQKRFYINASYSSNEIYKIPITYTTAISPDFDATKPAFIMDEKTHEFSIANISKEHSWVIFNIQETGFYRVNYDEHSWQIIASALKGNDYKDIHHLNRAKIVNDLFAFLYADEVEFSTLYNVLDFLQQESDYSVWFAALKGINQLWNSYLAHDDATPEIKEYILGIISTGIEKFGYEERSTDSFEDLRNRQQLLEFACKLDHSGCVEYSLALYKALKENGTEVPPSLRPVVYETGLRYGTGEDYDFLWNRMATTNLANEVWIIESALGHTSDEEKIKSYLTSMTLEDSPIRTQDLTTPLSSVLSNYSNLHIVMEQLKDEFTLWNEIYKTMDTILVTIASALRTESDFTEFEDFLMDCTQCTESSLTAARTSLNAAKGSKTWSDNHKSAILSKLENNTNAVMPSILLVIISLSILFTRQ